MQIARGSSFMQQRSAGPPGRSYARPRPANPSQGTALVSEEPGLPDWMIRSWLLSVLSHLWMRIPDPVVRRRPHAVHSRRPVRPCAVPAGCKSVVLPGQVQTAEFLRRWGGPQTPMLHEGPSVETPTHPKPSCSAVGGFFPTQPPAAWATVAQRFPTSFTAHAYTRGSISALAMTLSGFRRNT